MHFRETAPQERSLRFQVALPAKLVIASHGISPDGRYIVFAGPSGSDQSLWVRPLNLVAMQALPGTEGATFPFWSPDSKSIEFFSGGKLMRIEVAGGPARALIEGAGGLSGGAWSRAGEDDGNGGGVILFTSATTGTIMRIPANGAMASPVTKLRPGETSHRFPWFLPDGRHFFYSVVHEINGERSTIHIGDLLSPEDRVIGEADSQAVYSLGFLLFSRQQTLVAQAFDAKRRVATGVAFPQEQEIQRVAYTPYLDFSASANGLLAVHTGSSSDNLQLTWVDRAGKQLGQLGEPGRIDNFQISPDGKRAATGMLPSGTRNDGDVWIYDIASGLRTRFTFDPRTDLNPVWSPDGRYIIFASRREQHVDLYRKSADGAGTEELLFSDNMDKYPTSWSPDGKFLLYRGIEGGHGNVWVLPVTPERPGASLNPFPYALSPFEAGNGQFSPDGRWIAYAS